LADRAAIRKPRDPPINLAKRHASYEAAAIGEETWFWPSTTVTKARKR